MKICLVMVSGMLSDGIMFFFINSHNFVHEHSTEKKSILMLLNSLLILCRNLMMLQMSVMEHHSNTIKKKRIEGKDLKNDL